MLTINEAYANMSLVTIKQTQRKKIVMDTRYQPLYRQAATMQHKFHDFTHTTANDPMANVLRQQIHGLTNDLASNKNPGVIDRRLRTIQTQLRRTQAANPSAMPGQNPLINMNQKNFLNSNFERMRQNVIQHPNF